MPVILLHPGIEDTPAAGPAPTRLATLAGRTIGLLDISKPGGEVFLNRLEAMLRERAGVAEVIRARKPTFTKIAPAEVIASLRRADAVVEALAD